MRNNYGDALDDSDFSCSNAGYYTQSTCEAVGVCSDAVYTTQYICEGASSCSISDYTTQATCEDGGTCSNPDYTTLSECASNGSCSDGTSTTSPACNDAGGSWTYATWTSGIWTEVTWVQTNTWSASGVVDIYITLQEGCAYCDDTAYDTQYGCENNGNNGDGGIWSFDASIESATCSGVCTNSMIGSCSDSQYTIISTCVAAGKVWTNGVISQFQNLESCENNTENSEKGLCKQGTCSDTQYTGPSKCEDAGEVWTLDEFTSGKCTENEVPVSDYTTQYACEAADDDYVWELDDVTDCSFLGTCSDTQYTDKSTCEAADKVWTSSGTFEQNTFVRSDMNGKYIIGNISGFQFALFGMTVVDGNGASGGIAADNGFIVITQSVSVAANGDQMPNVLGYSLSGTTISAGDTPGVLTEISFTDLEQEGICFTSTPGTCSTDPDEFVDIFADQYGGCLAYADYGDCYCYGNLSEDCAGVCGGSAEYDCREGNTTTTGECSGGTGTSQTEVICEAAGGTWNDDAGSLLFPQNLSALYGYCDGSEDYVAVEADCAGVCNGSGLVNTDGDNECCASGTIDCNDVCDGGALLSLCGCGEPTIDSNGCCADGKSPDGVEKDCVGDCGGSAEVDCAGVCDGNAYIDSCGTCDDNPLNDCDGNCTVEVDCAGECGGSSEVDECGECEGNGWDSCDDDGNGINNKEQYGYGAYGLSAIDIPNDQGGYLYLSFNKSVFDTDTLTTVVPENWEGSGIEGYFVERLDNGIWTNITSSSAYGADSYQEEMITLADSTSISNALTEYRVIAAMFEGNFVSIETAIGYSLDNIAPETPESFSGVYDENNAVLSWNPSEVNDLSHYNIYRNAELHSTTTATSFTDEITEATVYAVSAVDIHENESDMSESILVSMFLNIIDNLIPTKYELMTAYPNPFNPITNIIYGLPEYTNVQIIIFDLSGKQVVSLINEFQSPGYHSINWNADNLPSGMYFVKMIAGEYVKTQKLMLVK